jgi:hypothetical protein
MSIAIAALLGSHIRDGIYLAMIGKAA